MCNWGALRVAAGGVNVEEQSALKVTHKGVVMGDYQADLLIEGRKGFGGSMSVRSRGRPHGILFSRRVKGVSIRSRAYSLGTMVSPN